MLSASSRSRCVSERTLELIPASAPTGRALARAPHPSNGQAFSLTFDLALEPLFTALPSIASTSGCSPLPYFFQRLTEVLKPLGRTFSQCSISSRYLP